MLLNSFPSVRELLDTQAERLGDSAFLKYVKDGNITEKTYKEVRSDSLAFCRMLRHTLDGRHNIALIGETSYEYIISLTGILISGCAAVPFSPELTADESIELFTAADIDMLIYDSKYSKTAEIIKEKTDVIKTFIFIGDSAHFDSIMNNYSEQSQYAALSDYEVDKDECAAIIFTSGTTGTRKGVMLSTNSLVGNIMYKDFNQDVFRENDVSLSVLPMYHIYCFTGDFIKNLKDGLQVCLNGNMRDITKNLRLFEPRVIRVVPMIAETLLRRVKRYKVKHPDASDIDAAHHVFGNNIRYLISGGAYLNPSLIKEYEKYGISLRQGYGMTEAGCRISVPDEDVDPSSVGRVLDICQIKTHNGEIRVKTPTMMLGYYKKPAETAEMFDEDGWLKTGDIGYVTADRQLFITGRVKNLIILSSGENVSPEAIEKKYADYHIIKEVMAYAKNDRIVAEFYPDFEYAEKIGIHDIKKEITHITDSLNVKAKTSHFISEIIFRDTPFEKTGSGKIKRKRTKI